MFVWSVVSFDIDVWKDIDIATCFISWQTTESVGKRHSLGWVYMLTTLDPTHGDVCLFHWKPGLSRYVETIEPKWYNTNEMVKLSLVWNSNY